MNNSEKSNWLVVFVAVGAGVTAASFLGKAPPAIPLIRAELDLDLVSAGWVVSIVAAMSMAVGMMAGLIADIIGHRRLLMIGLAILALGGGAGAFAETPVFLLVTRFIEGVGYISVIVSAPSLIITSTLERHRHLALGIWGVFMPTGIALAMLVSPLLIGSFGWRGLWMGLAIFSALLIFVIRAANPPPRKKTANDRPPVMTSIRLVLAKPGPVLLALGFGLYAANWTSIMMWLPSFLVEQRAMSIAAATMLGALIVAINIPGNVFGGVVLHHGAKRWQVIAVVHAIVGISAIGIFSNSVPDWGRVVLCLVFSFVGGHLPAACFASVPIHAPSRHQLSMISGMLMQGSNTGNFFGPVVLAAIVTAVGGWEAVVWMVGGCSTVGIVVALALGYFERNMDSSKQL